MDEFQGAKALAPQRQRGVTTYRLQSTGRARACAVAIGQLALVGVARVPCCFRTGRRAIDGTILGEDQDGGKGEERKG